MPFPRTLARILIDSTNDVGPAILTVTARNGIWWAVLDQRDGTPPATRSGFNPQDALAKLDAYLEELTH